MSDPGSCWRKNHAAEGKNDSRPQIDFPRPPSEHRAEARRGANDGQTESDCAPNGNAETVNQQRNGEDRTAAASQAE